MEREPVAQLARHQYFYHVGRNIYDEANCKYQYALVERKFGGKCGSRAEPEQKYIRVQCIDQKSGGEYFHYLCFAETKDASIGILQFYFFEKNIEYAHDDQEYAAGDAEHFPVYH